MVVDARALYTSGLGRYLRSILTGLFSDDRFASFHLIGPTAEIDDFAVSAGVGSVVTSTPFPTELYTPRSQLHWQRLRQRGSLNADVSFWPHYDVPLAFLPTRSVVTVHDLIHFEVPEVFSGWRKAAAGVLLGRAVKQAGRVITVSEQTRADLIRHHPSAERKTEVVSNGVGASFRPLEAVADTPRPFILCVGNRKPHKNHVAAVEVLSLVRKVVPTTTLVIVGASFGASDGVRERAGQLRLDGHVTELESVPDAELRKLYSSCAVLLFPSLYEGFGLPIIEAMACGAPVVASNRSSMPEVAGSAAALCEPDDYDRMAAEVLQVMTNPAARADARSRGFEQSGKFSWTNATARTADILYKVATEGRRDGSGLASVSVGVES